MTGERILVIDDDRLVREMVSDLLSDEGYEVALASNGHEGLALLGRGEFSAVVTDILMPEKEGVQTILEIKKARPNLGIIAISGGGRTGNFHPLKIARTAGADVILTKPFDPDDLVKAVRSLGTRKPGAPAGHNRKVS